MARTKKFTPPTDYFIHFNSEQLKELKDSFEMVKGCIPKRPTHPILGCYKFTADSQTGEVSLTAFDLRECLQVTLQANVNNNLFGSTFQEFCIPELVREMLPKQDDEMWVLIDDSTHIITLVSESGRFETSYIEASEYPALPKAENLKHLLLGSDDFIEADRVCAPFAASDETKQVLTGVNIKFTAPKNKTDERGEVESALVYATTDGHRASVYRTTPLIQSVDDTEVTIPAGAFSRIAKLLKTASVADVRVTFDGGMLSVALPNITYFSRLLEGDYPKYEQLIPKRFEGELTADTNIFKEAMGVLQALSKSDPKRKIGSLHIASGDEDCILTEEVAGKGAVTRFVSAVVVGAGDRAIGFNIDYLADAVKVLGPVMQLHYNSPTSPMILRDGGYTHLIMPVQIR